jgi:hypothetical protein
VYTREDYAADQIDHAHKWLTAAGESALVIVAAEYTDGNEPYAIYEKPDGTKIALSSQARELTPEQRKVWTEQRAKADAQEKQQALAHIRAQKESWEWETKRVEREAQHRLEALSSAELGVKIVELLDDDLERNWPRIEELATYRAASQKREEGDLTFQKMHKDFVKKHEGPTGGGRGLTLITVAGYTILTLGLLAALLTPGLWLLVPIIGALGSWMEHTLRHHPRKPRARSNAQGKRAAGACIHGVKLHTHCDRCPWKVSKRGGRG